MFRIAWEFWKYYHPVIKLDRYFIYLNKMRSKMRSYISHLGNVMQTPQPMPPRPPCQYMPLHQRQVILALPAARVPPSAMVVKPKALLEEKVVDVALTSTTKKADLVVQSIQTVLLALTSTTLKVDLVIRDDTTDIPNILILEDNRKKRLHATIM